MNCPACQTVMREREKEDVIIDVCPNCKGMWLDHGELEKLVAIEAGRSGKYRKYYDDDDDDDDDRGPGRGTSATQSPPKKKKGFFSTLMETVGGEGADD
ncbi:MAG TPA: zf-TFIIB domain-containing protein [Tepidiformaceae bacterium]|nr:zf-TFIIB domain-containing protein [Tepidiformaceae bacterium]